MDLVSYQFDNQDLDLLREQKQVEAFWDQLLKDSAFYGEEFVSFKRSKANGYSFDERYLVEQFVADLAQDLSVFCQQSNEEFFNTIYRIDIPERLIDELLLRGSPDWNKISYTVARRILLKLALRKTYSGF